MVAVRRWPRQDCRARTALPTADRVRDVRDESRALQSLRVRSPSDSRASLTTHATEQPPRRDASPSARRAAAIQRSLEARAGTLLQSPAQVDVTERERLARVANRVGAAARHVQQ